MPNSANVRARAVDVPTRDLALQNPNQLAKALNPRLPNTLMKFVIIRVVIEIRDNRSNSHNTSSNNTNKK